MQIDLIISLSFHHSTNHSLTCVPTLKFQFSNILLFGVPVDFGSEQFWKEQYPLLSLLKLRLMP